ncbi:hypothetical protein BYT27DRAFT_7194296, partial [Phlegmacium glaucopus]
NDALDSSPEPATSTSTTKTSAADPMPFILASAATASAQVIQVSDVTTAHDLRVSTSVSALATNPVSVPDTGVNTTHELQVSASNLGSTESEQNPLVMLSAFAHNQQAQQSALGLFVNAQNILITGSTINNVILPANTGEGQVNIPVTHKPNSSPIFTGRQDVLDKLGKIFVHRATSRLMSRRFCLLWGLGGIGKTQICLKFIEEMSDK